MNKTKTEQILEEIKKRRELQQRAHIEEEKIELVIFTLLSDYYAFYGADVKEILPYEEITFVPGCPDFIIGIINVRGDIESVMNIHKIAGLPESKPTKDTRIIIAEKADIRSGILVDSVEDVIMVSSEMIKPPISTMEKGMREFTVGGETIYHQKYVTVLDIGKLFEKIRL